jgi:hypothetical protein
VENFGQIIWDKIKVSKGDMKDPKTPIFGLN